MAAKQTSRRHLSCLAFPVLLLVLAACGRRVYPTAPTLPTVAATASATPSGLGTPTATLTPTPPSTDEVLALESTARAWMATPEYARAIPIWDEILAARPDYGEGYFQRGRAYLGIEDSVGLVEDYVANALRSLADLDRSIVLGPAVDGRNYYRRFQAFENLAGIEPLRAGRDVLEQIALENLRVSNSIGPWDDISQTQEGLLLSTLGQCSEALEVGERLLRYYTQYFGDDPSWDPGLARAWSVIGSAATCDGRSVDAVEAYSRALSLDPEGEHWFWSFIRALNLYYMGHLEEALVSLTQDIDAHPYYSGERYFLRALILYDLGDRDAAMDDLEYGAFQTWMQIGLYPYVVGRVALDEGRVSEAVEALQSAEATFTREYAPLIEWTRRKLAELGAQPLELTPSPWYETTPIPTLTPSPTPRIPILHGTPAYHDAHVVDMSVGTGPLMIRPHQDFVYAFRFQAQVPIDPTSVVDLTYRLIPFEGTPGEWTGLEVRILTAEWGMQTASSRWGDNRVYDPESHFRDNGEVMMILDNPGDLPVYLQDVGMRLVASRADGFLVLGPGSAPHLEVLPLEGVDMEIDLPGRTGPLSLAPGESHIIHFAPSEPIDYALVEYLRYRVVNADPAGPPPDVIPWGPWSGGWGSTTRVQPDLFDVLGPAAAVDADGDVVVSIENRTGMPLQILDASVEVSYLMPDGKVLRLGAVQ